MIRALVRGTMRAETGAFTLGFASVVEVATMAFLVAFKLLSRDFF